MFYNLLYPLADVFSPFNIFRYLTFRSIAAFLTALVLSFLIGGGLIRWLRSKQAQGQPIRNDGPATQVTKKNPKGVPGKIKLAISIVVAAIAAYLIAQASPSPLRYMMALPFLKDVLLPLGIVGFLAFSVVVMVGASNAVNLTDGLDGLAIGPVIMASAVFGLIAYVVGNTILTNYLYLHHVPRSGELAVLLAALIGAGLGFLWFNAPPAMVFMGDTGSLAIGGALGAVAVVTKHEIVLAIVGGLFVLETVSVMVQVLSYKLTGRRVFRMAPLHHHFEQKGWAEPTIVFRFWIIAAILAMAGLATLKLR